MMRYSADKLSGIDLGRQGENLARTIEIDVSSLLAQWPEAAISLLVKRKHDTDPYVANTEVRDGVLYWPITAADTASAGDGKVELRAVCGEVLAKSATGSTRVASSLTGNETEPPEASQGWVDQVLTAGSIVQTSAKNAEDAAERAKKTADTLSGIGAKAVTIEPGTEATVEVIDGVIIYGIPRGKDGNNAVVDATLTQSGQAADAKVTGDEIGKLKDDIVNISEAIDDAENNIYKCVVDETISAEVTERTQLRYYFPCKIRKGYEFKCVISNALSNSVENIVLLRLRLNLAMKALLCATLLMRSS